MAFINENSPVVALPQLELFDTMPIQTSIDDTTEQEYIPVCQLNTGSNTEIIVKTHDNEFIKPLDIMLRVRFNVHLRHSDNTAITEDHWKSLSLINNIGHSLWSGVDLAAGETLLTTPSNTYPLKAYIKNAINMTSEAKSTIGKLIGFTDENFTSSTTANSPNEERKKYIKYVEGTNKGIGRLCELWVPLCIDFLNQPKDIIGGIELKFKFIPSRPEFLFMCSDPKLIPSINYKDIILYGSEQTINTDVTIGIHQGLLMSPARYAINNEEVRTHTIDQGTNIRNLDNILSGTLPRYVLLMFANNEAVAGSYTKNPFYFNHYNVGSIACYANSQLVGRKPQKPDYTLPFFMKEYINFLKVIGQWGNHIQTTITPEMYKNGYTIFAWDLTRDGSHGYFKSGYVDPPKTRSTLKFTVQFNNPLPETISAIIFCSWDEQINFDALKNAIVNSK